MIRVTLDSNIYISALQFGGIGTRLIGMAMTEIIRIDISEAILAEVVGVLRDKFGWDGYRLHFASLELRRLATLVTTTRTLSVTDDPDDNRILECAVAGDSEWIITEDKDLLRLGSFQGIKIARAADFLNREPS